MRRGPGSYQYRVKCDRRGPAASKPPAGFFFSGPRSCHLAPALFSAQRLVQQHFEVRLVANSLLGGQFSRSLQVRGRKANRCRPSHPSGRPVPVKAVFHGEIENCLVCPLMPLGFVILVAKLRHVTNADRAVLLSVKAYLFPDALQPICLELFRGKLGSFRQIEKRG